jgi:hypothetical protein
MTQGSLDKELTVGTGKRHHQTSGKPCTLGQGGIGAAVENHQ